jgi:hypothetical protein
LAATLTKGADNSEFIGLRQSFLVAGFDASFGCREKKRASRSSTGARVFQSEAGRLVWLHPSSNWLYSPAQEIRLIPNINVRKQSDVIFRWPSLSLWFEMLIGQG